MKSDSIQRQEFYSRGEQRSFTGDATEAAFLLGGIGTGNVSLGARGELRDWEIFNRPGKGANLPYSFFAVWAQPEGGEKIARVLESRLQPPFSKSHGFSAGDVGGLPRLMSSRMKGEYPFVQVDFEDEELPIQVSLEAFTPFIPLNADDSGIPGAVFRYKVKNLLQKPVTVAIARSQMNPAGFSGYDLFGNMKIRAHQKNEYRYQDGLGGVFYSAEDLTEDSLHFGNMSVMTLDEATSAKATWLRGGWWDGIHDFWDDFCDDGVLEPESENTAVGNRMHNVGFQVGSLAISHTLQPGEEKVFEFILTWYFPNRVTAWDEDSCCDAQQITRNYYATLFTSSWHAGQYLLENMTSLEKASRDFQQAVFGSTLPGYVLDAVASNITVLRSTTCFRLENGTFLGWEGCHNTKGCCEGSCTHVWNYAQTLAFLFPELERSMRRVEFELETDDSGNMAFRTHQVFGGKKFDMLPATDGQLGTIVRLYRDWKLSGDEQFLQDLWPKAAKALDFAISYWDSDGDYVLDSQQHNTYDIEFFGPNSLTNSIFYAALKAGAEIATHLGDKRVSKYREALAIGSKRMDELLWNGEYYIQQIDDVDKCRYQYGTGCLADQVFGQMLAHVAGLGYVLPPEHVKKAVHAIYTHNFRTSLATHHNVQRTYALNDEMGLLLCSWPNGGRPRLPFVYSDEVWTGIEYQVAAHLIYEGYLDEGLTIVKAVRDRHDGYRRNPWNEVECGHHYARSMASWAVLTALSGFKYDMSAKQMSFDPVINRDNFSTFWSTGTAWGVYTQTEDAQTGIRRWNIKVLYGHLDSVSVNE